MKKRASRGLLLIAGVASFYSPYLCASDGVPKKDLSELAIRLDHESLQVSSDRMLFASGTCVMQDQTVHQLFTIHQSGSGTKIVPIIQKQAITEKGVEENPLWNKKIKLFFPLPTGHVLIVLEETPAVLYGLIFNKATNTVSSLDAIKTSAGQACEEILSIAFMGGDAFCILAQHKKDQPFARMGTGITSVQVGSKGEKVAYEGAEKNCTFITMRQDAQLPFDTRRGVISESSEKELKQDQYRYAVECVFDGTIKNDAARPLFFDLGEHAQLFGSAENIELFLPGTGLRYDPFSKSILLSLHCKTQEHNTHSVHTTLSIRWLAYQEAIKQEKKSESGDTATNLDQKKETPVVHKYLSIRSIFGGINLDDNNNYVFATNKAGDWVKNEQIIPIQTTTNHRYFIVRSTGGKNEQSLFMIPAILSKNNDLALADKTAQLARKAPERGQRRSIQISTTSIPAQSSSQLLGYQQDECQIDMSDLPGVITHVQAYEDCIFASTEHTELNENRPSGIFMSRALFASDGKIAGWSRWRRINGICANVKHFHFDLDQKTIFYAQSEQEKDVVKVTGLDLMTFMAQVHTVSEKVTQLETTPHSIENFFTGAEANQDNVVAFLSDSQLLLVNAAQGSQSLETLISEDEACLRIAIDEHATIGTYRSICLIYDHLKMQSWITVVGDKGIAVLAHENRTGISTAASGSEFLLQAKEQKWICIRSDYPIKKILSAHGSLFILSSKQLYRVDVDAETLPSCLSSGVSLFNQENTLLFDMAVSGPLIALATSRGLVRNSDYTSAELIGVGQDADWTIVELPYQIKPVIRLHLVHRNPFDTDSVQPAMLYVISSFRGQHKSTLHRLAIAPDSQVTNTTLLPVDDWRYAEQVPFLVTNIYQDHIFTDGLQHYCICKTKEVSGLAQIEQAKLRCLSFEDNKIVHTIVCCQATGQYLISGSQSLQVSR